MGLKVEGTQALMAMLEQVGERAVRGVSDEIKKGAEEIAELAIKYAPVDEGNLEDAIKVEFDRYGINRRIRATVYVDLDVRGADGVPVGRYAMAMHEGLAPYGSGAFNLGAKSRAKDGGTGRVGGKYLERAINELSPEIFARVQRKIKSYF